MEHSYRAGHNLSLLIYASLETKLAFNNFNMSALLHLFCVGETLLKQCVLLEHA